MLGLWDNYAFASSVLFRWAASPFFRGHLFQTCLPIPQYGLVGTQEHGPGQIRAYRQGPDILL